MPHFSHKHKLACMPPCSTRPPRPPLGDGSSLLVSASASSRVPTTRIRRRMASPHATWAATGGQHSSGALPATAIGAAWVVNERMHALPAHEPCVARPHALRSCSSPSGLHHPADHILVLQPIGQEPGGQQHSPGGSIAAAVAWVPATLLHGSAPQSWRTLVQRPQYLLALWAPPAQCVCRSELA